MESYTKPLAKYKERASQWGRQGLGLHLSLRAYSVYIASVLSFVTQLEPLPLELFDAAELFMCRRLFPGPNYWVKPAVLHQLRELGSNICLQDLRVTSVAARSRVFRASAGGGADIRRRERRLQQTFAISGVSHCLWLRTWADANFFSNVVDADRQVDAAIAARRAANALPLRFVRFAENRTDEDGKTRQWQPVATALMHQSTMVATVAHMGNRLRRLKLDILPGDRVTRARRILGELYTLTATRVVAAVLRCFLNGWTTQRRLFGIRGCRCRLGCRIGTDDLEHIISCPFAHQLAERHLQIRQPPVNKRADASMCMSEAYLDGSCLLNGPSDRDAVLRARATSMYALYSVYNALRHNSISLAELDGAFAQSCRNARLAFHADED